eukprot:2166-Heterococcus_DN1.PRE.4
MFSGPSSFSGKMRAVRIEERLLRCRKKRRRGTGRTIPRRILGTPPTAEPRTLCGFAMCEDRVKALVHAALLTAGALHRQQLRQLHIAVLLTQTAVAVRR